MSFFVYIMTNGRRGALYTGMTDDLFRRVGEHKEGVVPGFTKKYGITLLVWFEVHETRENAFARERSIKKWNRQWKVDLIEAANPNWSDLFPELSL